MSETEDLYNKLQQQKDDLDKINNLLKQIDEMRQRQQPPHSTSVTIDGTTEEQLKKMKAFLMKTRCEMYSLAEGIKSLNARIDFLEGYLNKQFKTFEKQVNEIISFCNGLTIVGYEDEDGNIVDYPKEESDDEIDEDL